MRFYTIKEDYIQYLKAIDPKVPDNYSEKRPYIGIVLEIAGHKYLAPLTSYKKKQDDIPASRESIFKIHKKNDENNKLGMININNMIPVLDSVISEIDISTQPSPYKQMLTLQYAFIKSKKDEIKKKVEDYYYLVSVHKNTFFTTISCDLNLLEAEYRKYK